MLFKTTKGLLTYFAVSNLGIWIIEVLYHLSGFQNIYLIIVGICIECICFLYLVKTKMFFSPIIMADIYTICVLFYQLKLVEYYKDLEVKALVIIMICMFIWKAIHLYDINTVMAARTKKTFVFNLNRTKFQQYIIVAFCISSLFMILEWIYAGGIPIFRADGEIFRFSVTINGITHILAIMNKIVAILIISYLIAKDKVIISRDYLLILILIVSMILILFTNMRGELFVIVFSFVVLTYVKNKPGLFKIIPVVIILAIVVGIIPLFRKYGLYEALYISDQKSISTYPELWFLTPLYQTLADSIRVFGTITEMFPKSFDFGIVSYSVLPQIPFVDLGQSVSNSIAVYTNSAFYSGLTSTYLGVAYADGGILSCAIYTIIFALWSKSIYKKFMLIGDFKYTVLYAYFMYEVVMLAYGSMMDLAFFCYYIFIILVCNISRTKRLRIVDS